MMIWYPKIRIDSLRASFHAQKVVSSNPTHEVATLEIYAVVVPVTAKVQRIRKSWPDETFHFCCNLLNIVQREEKKGFSAVFTNLIISMPSKLTFL